MQAADVELTEAVATRVFRHTWQPVAVSAELREGGIALFTLLGERIAIARFAGSVLAVADGCPHKGASFEIARIENGELVCGYHGWRFAASGECVAIPSLGRCPPQLQHRANLKPLAVREAYGFVWVRLEDEELAPFPRLEVLERPGWSYLAAPPMRFACGFRREIENFLDMTHFAFAHRASLGTAANPLAPPVSIVEHEFGFRAETIFPATHGAALKSRLQGEHKRTYVHHLPNVTSIIMTFENGDERMLLHIPSMNDGEHCSVFWALAQSPGFDGPPLEEQLPFGTAVLDEDRRICESQYPREVPIAPGTGDAGVLVTPGDAMANAYQRSLRRFLQKVVR
jgi:vanillate O-demethylase monooxygenase subunit